MKKQPVWAVFLFEFFIFLSLVVLQSFSSQNVKVFAEYRLQSLHGNLPGLRLELEPLSLLVSISHHVLLLLVLLYQLVHQVFQLHILHPEVRLKALHAVLY